MIKYQASIITAKWWGSLLKVDGKYKEFTDKVEWNGKYLLMDQPLQLTEQPLLIYDAKE